MKHSVYLCALVGALELSSVLHAQEPLPPCASGSHLGYQAATATAIDATTFWRTEDSVDPFVVRVELRNNLPCMTNYSVLIPAHNVAYTTVSSSSGEIGSEPVVVEFRIDPLLMPATSGTTSIRPSFLVGGSSSFHGNQQDFTITSRFPGCTGEPFSNYWLISTWREADCNKNGIPDSCELTSASDANGDGILDSCAQIFSTIPYRTEFDDTPGFEWLWTGTETSYNFYPSSSGAADDRVARLTDPLGQRIPLFSADFQTDQSAEFLYSVNDVTHHGDGLIDFNFDAADFGIGPAPRSSAEEAAHRVLLMKANDSDGLRGPVRNTVIPKDEAVHDLDEFYLRFDAWKSVTPAVDLTHWQEAMDRLEFGPFSFDPRWITGPAGGRGWAVQIGGAPMAYRYFLSTVFGGTNAERGEVISWFYGRQALFDVFPRDVYEVEGSPGGSWVTYEMYFRKDMASIWMTPSIGPYAGQRMMAACWAPQLGSSAVRDIRYGATPFIGLINDMGYFSDEANDQFLMIDNVELYPTVSNDLPATNYLTLGLDLAGRDGVVIDFDAHVFNHASDEALTGPQVGNIEANAVLLSVDHGGTWYELGSLRERTDGFEHFEFPISSVATANSLELTSTTLVRFAQYGDLGYEEGGYDIERVRVTDGTSQSPTLRMSEAPLAVTTAPQSTPVRVTRAFQNMGGGQLTANCSVDLDFVALDSPTVISRIREEEIGLTIDVAGIPAGTAIAGSLLVEFPELSRTVTIPLTIKVDFPDSVPSGATQSPVTPPSFLWNDWKFSAPQAATMPGTAYYAFDYIYNSPGILLTSALAYGILESPTIYPNGVAGQTPALPNRGIRSGGTDEVYRYTGVIVPGFSQDAPAIRLRVSEISHHRSDMLIIGNEQPTFELGQYFGGVPTELRPSVIVPATANPVKLFLESYSGAPYDSGTVRHVFRSADYAVGPLSSQMRFPLGPLVWDFTDGADHGFSTFTSAGFGAPNELSATEQGLLIRGIDPSASNGDPGEIVFGAWESPMVARHGGAESCLRIRWTIATDAETSETAKVPTFRLRMNDEFLAVSTITQIDSVTDGVGIPAAGDTKVYETYYRPPGGMDSPYRHTSPSFRLSFDYLYTPEVDDDARIGIYLQRIEVTRYLPR